MKNLFQLIPACFLLFLTALGPLPRAWPETCQALYTGPSAPMPGQQKSAYDLIVSLKTSLSPASVRQDIWQATFRSALEHLQAQTPYIQSPRDLVPFIEFAMKTEVFWAPALKSRPQNEYLNVLKYFDLKTLALLHQGRLLSEIPSLDYVKQAAKLLHERQQKIEVQKIETGDDFMKAAGLLLGRQIRFRHDDVIMTAELQSDNPHLLGFDTKTASNLRKNKWLNLYDQSRVQNRKLQAGVDYLTIATLQKLLRDEKIEFPAKLRSQVLELPSISGVAPAQSIAREIYRQALKELVRILVEEPFSSAGQKIADLVGNGEIGALQYYKAYMSIHPLIDGNGRSGRLYYELLLSRLQSESSGLELPIFDLDLMPVIPDSEMLRLGSFLNSWVALAGNDSEFLARADLALKALFIFKPELKTIFPEIGGADEASN